MRITFAVGSERYPRQFISLFALLLDIIRYGQHISRLFRKRAAVVRINGKWIPVRAEDYLIPSCNV